MTTRIVEVRKNILKKNDLLAHVLRTRFEAAGVCVINVVSAPGSGKTAFLERLMTDLQRDHRVGAIVGDLATDNDARRLANSGAQVKQITTGTICHLDAEMVAAALEEFDLANLDFLFVENVGNLVCPASYDLGERMRMVLLSVTEGEDKPLKYPTIFNTADIAVVTKSDIADAVGFDRETAYKNIRQIRPDVEIVEVSSRSGSGMAEVIALLKQVAAGGSRWQQVVVSR